MFLSTRTPALSGAAPIQRPAGAQLAHSRAPDIEFCHWPPSRMSAQYRHCTLARAQQRRPPGRRKPASAVPRQPDNQIPVLRAWCAKAGGGHVQL